MPACPVCATENPDVARFCLACGAALSAEPAREERKVVTVLFADLVGFTSRAEQLDPEDVRAVLAPYWERLRGELEKRGGTVEKFIGDAVMALFGAPVAHDDDPLRAVGAALAIRDWAREEADVQVRIAVNTGEALIVLGARPSEGEGMAAGDVVNTTARLQSAAPVNGVLVGETTYRATRDVIDYAEHEPVTAKGKAEPIPVWEAVQIRSRLGMDVERATTPLVGRKRELAVIVDAFDRAKSEREPQLVTLVGVPGIGKSRLVGAFFSHLESSPDLVWWRQGRAMPYGEGVSFWAVAEMVKAQAGIEENDPSDVAARKLRASVEHIVEADKAWVAEHLLPLVGVDERRGSGESAPAWRAYFEALAEQRPLVMVFEDMHWADDGLLDFIDHLVDWATGAPLMVIATARPELLERRPAWGGGKLNVSTVALTPLSDDEAAQIIHGVLEQAALPAETQQALLDRAGGNPLYAEQFARLYLERGTADDLPMPETVQGLIAARLDGLSPEEKRIVQDASVFGKVFWAGALQADEQSLHALERKGMLRRERRSAVGGETQYAFRHVLVRDVAYGQIPRVARAEKHVRAADWIEALGRADDQAELVAHHLGTALDLGLPVAERARVAFRSAGDRAYALGSFPVALGYYDRALAHWPDDDGRPNLLAMHARATFKTGGETALLHEALAAVEATRPRQEAADLAVFVASAEWYVGNAHAAHAAIDRARALVEGSDDDAVRVAVLSEGARIALFTGRMDDARRDLPVALELAEKLGLDEVRAAALTTIGVLQLHDGEIDGARASCEAAATIAPPGSGALMRALANRAVVDAIEGGHPDDFLHWNRLAADAAARAGDSANLRWTEAQLIPWLYVDGRWDELLTRSAAFLAEGPHYLSQSIQIYQAIVSAARGHAERARALRAEVLAATSDRDDLQQQIGNRMQLAWVSLLLEDDELAVELVAGTAPLVSRIAHRAPGVSADVTVTQIRTGLGARWLELHAGHADTNRVVAARLLLEGRCVEAAERYASISREEEAVARLEAARQLRAAGRDAEADAQLERGLAFFRAVGATRVIQQAERPLRAAAAAE